MYVGYVCVYIGGGVCWMCLCVYRRGVCWMCLCVYRRGCMLDMFVCI